MNFLYFLITILLTFKFSSTQFNSTQYYKMPPLHSFDNYEDCMVDQEKAVYCMVYGKINPNKTSVLWNQIEDFSKDTKHHFNHNILSFGVCLKQCEIINSKMKIEALNEVDENILNLEEVPDYFLLFHDASSTYLNYNIIVNECLNFGFNKKFDLTLKTKIEYCTTNKEEISNDLLDVIFYIVVGIITTSVVLSSLYDFWLKKNLPLTMQNNHYKNSSLDNGKSILVSFSMYRNWYRLSSPSNSKFSREFRFLEGFKFLVMNGVVIAHTILLMHVNATLNPEYIESYYHNIGKVVLLNITIFIQSFFVISGFLLSIGFYSYNENSKKGNCLKVIVFRYLRYTPAAAFMILFHATAFVKIQDGPLWKRFAETEKMYCRMNWWTNLLYINNYYMTSKPCLQQSWYLAAEFQLFSICLLILVIISRYPKLKTLILGATITLSIIFPAVICYIYAFDGTFIITPENSKLLYWEDKAFQQFYIPTHTNLGCYVIGLIAGIIFIKCKERNYNLFLKKIVAYLFYMGTPASILIFLSGCLFYTQEYEKPSIWIAVYAGCFRTLWGMFNAVLLLGTAFGSYWIFRDFFCYSGFRILGRLTLGVFVCHSFILRAMIGSSRQPIYMNDITMYTYALSALVMTYMAALVSALFIELPTSAILKNVLIKLK